MLQFKGNKGDIMKVKIKYLPNTNKIEVKVLDKITGLVVQSNHNLRLAIAINKAAIKGRRLPKVGASAWIG
jgi:hypothetical protein